MEMGTALHCLTLDGEKAFEAQYAKKPDGIKLTTKEGKEWKESIGRKKVLNTGGKEEDEINFMESWLKSRKETKTNTSHNHHMHMEMAGMASPEQLIELENSKSTDFDRLFLQLMIAHHDGALEMVEELKKYPGSANEPLLNEFVADLVNDQGVEIERMNIIAVNLSDDPRSGLAAGLFIADEAILNLELIASPVMMVDFIFGMMMARQPSG